MRVSSVIFSVLSLVAFSQAAECPAGTQPNCCQNLNENKVGYYCAEPGATYCQEPGQTLIPVCCTKYSNTPRGYTGEGCTKL
ncbi:hypothetical protein MGYG_07727 [Nannizzia gypsea CBS 118893]|uniref:Uncharacterized protein n=1 Tax=Arthroderma gypseum (strain ATCC MYA-4604 / CBS 118893) TaxID=535722 RepID=E4V3Z5_ARTGP|nr:hypothetical protein MGYG_07727 [Nannizzia gypsea CBS 118893]EFR04719.1 hypothetical protein MGYG_07727 [Nannizzia gypsea CBS 118893]